jgi:4-phospho-D-threonate 3-dehydrogenase / 4-phospho-D-erythronate 3-dehydrogenase
MNDKRPILGISMGDPSGIGPEIAALALGNKEIYDICKPLIVGDANILKLGAKAAGIELAVRSVSKVEQAAFKFGEADVLDLKNVDMETFKYGKVSAMSGKVAFEAIEKMIGLAMEKKIDATVTGPINKESINLAGFKFSGHTEIYASYTQTSNYSMLLVEGSLRVVHVSTHVSLRQACDLVTKERVLRMIRLAHDACRTFGILNPRVGVAGLNPHAGENGMFGWEEQKEILPAIEEARSSGIRVEGPIPPDTLFSKAHGGWYDIVVAMYHDQGHIPLKVLGFRWNEQEKKWESVNGVNITLGLPIIRTSVDHGTAFDIAGKGIASEKSLVSAITYAAKMAVEKGND